MNPLYIRISAIVVVALLFVTGCGEEKTPTMNNDENSPPPSGRESVMADVSDSAGGDGDHFFYVKIPGNIQPIERGERFEDPLQDALEAADLGEVTGGGSQLAEGGGIEYCGINVVVSDRERGLALIVATMRKLEAPQGTVVQESKPTRQDHPVFDTGSEQGVGPNGP
jgi:hypothetical protein